MKLTNIHIENFLGARCVDVSLSKPINLFCGGNASGKSSCRDAIALALTGDLARVALKKEAGQLVSDGANAARVEIGVDGIAEPACVNISAAGKITAKHLAVSAMLPYVLDAQRFAGLTPTDRRAFLFGLMGLKSDGPAVAARLAAIGCDMGKAERIAPLLRSGFDAACTEAKSHATQARGAWKATTGEAYGSEKAKTWRAALPGAVAEGEPTDPALLKACEAALESWQREIGKLQGQVQRRADLQIRLPVAQESASRLARAQTKLATDEAELVSIADQLERARAAAGAGPRVGLVHELARSLNVMINAMQDGDEEGLFGYAEPVVEARAALAHYELEHGPVGTISGDPVARERLPALEQSHALLTRAIANDRRDIEAAQRDQAAAEEISAELAQPLDAAALATARQQVEQLKAERTAILARLDAVASAKRAAEAATKKTSEAAQHHADVCVWERIADALAPNGIPAEMLAEALGPINERLAQSAIDAEWPRIGVEADMAITVGADARLYSLCSESEQWRADAMLAEAISHLSGLKLLVLDRFDVLDLQGRGDLLAWLDVLASNNEIDAALLFGTLKALPAGLPATVAAHWIDNGHTGQTLKAAA